MATESPLIHDGAHTVAGADFRNSTNSGTTHAGPNGSPQFQAVRLSTTALNADEPATVNLCTASGQNIYGILQNKPAAGEAADVGIFGVSLVIAGSTSVVAGGPLMVDSSGCLIPYSSAADRVKVGYALEGASAVGEAISAAIFGFGAGGGSVA